MNQSREEGPASNPAGHRSWRGQAALDTPVARHRWQRDWTALPAQRGRFRQHWQRLRMLVLFIAFGGLLALLSYLLLQSPIQTPVIAIAATQYDAPWPINAYGAEDLQRLATLHRKSLRLVDATAQWSSRDRALESLRRHLEHLDQSSSNAHALIVYISAIGAVDDAGQPCLILPGAAVLDASTWLPVNDVLQAIQASAGEQRQALVVLDCVRDTTLPAAGIVRNEFVEGLDDLLQKIDAARLAILVANQTGDRAWSSSNLGQTVFGHYFQRGLAGEADYVTSGGDGNRRVTVRELQHYLLTHVDAWAQQQRGARQRPQLIPGSGNFEVAWVIRNSQKRTTSVAATISAEQLDTLWRLRDGLTSAQLDRVDPLAWQDLQHQLVRVAEMSQAGEAYALPARRAYTQVRKQLEKLAQEKERLQRLGSDVAWRTALVGEPLFPTNAERLHSLPLLRTFTSGDAAAVSDLTARLKDLAKNPSEENITQLLASAKNGPIASTAEVRSLQLFQQYVPQNAAGALPDVLADRLLAEQVAVPQDVRALAWLKPLLDAADQQRRNAEDELFSGDSAAARIAAAAAKEYDAIRAATDRVSEAFATCDQACAELPAWCLWVGRARPALQSLAHGEEVIKALTELMRETELLATQLAEPAGHADNAQRIAAIAQIADRVQKGLQLLSTVARTEQQQLLTEQNEKRWPASICEIEALLALPMLKAEQRQALIDRHAQLATALAGQPIKLTTRKSANEEPTADGSPPVGAHPLLLIATVLAKGDEGELADNPSLAALRAAWQRVARQSAAEDEFPAAREYQARLAIAAGVPLEQDIVSALRRADWQAAWIWYARRGLDDFLGPLTAKAQPLFAVAAEDYLQLARTSHPEITAGPRAALDDVARLLSERRTAAKEGVIIDAHNSLVLFSDQGSRTAIEIAPHDDSPLPAGRLALTVQTSTGRPIEATIQFAESGQQTFGIETPLPAKPVRLEMLGQSLGGSPALLRVVAHQRGNAFSAPLVIRAAMGPTVYVEPTLVKQSSVVVNGAQRKKPAVIVVLDCSKSMEAPVPVEATDGRAITKLEAAKNALQTMLNQLAREGDAVVGVKLVGHRVGWTTREPLRISKQTKYGRAIPESVSPHNDVESALTVGRFDALAAGEVSSLLKTVVPWGQSPLYLGVIESLNELANLDEDVDANIIVITDGLNYQFLPSTTEVVPPDSTQSVDDVIRAADGKAIRVHLVGFAVDRSEAAAAEEQFSRIAKATNGTYQPLNDASRIIPHLESLLGPSTWQLTAQTAAGQPSDQALVAELGQSQSINIVPGEENRWEAVFRSAGEALTLRGGEAVALRVAASGQRLDALPYPGNSPVLARLVSGESKVDTGYLVAVDRPVRTREGGLQLAVSLRQTDDHFVARPAELWIEATPRSLQGTAVGPTHLYYDTVFVNGETSPVVRWNPGQWPSKADAVEVRCWFQPLTVEAAVSQPVLELAAKRTPVTDPAISEQSWLVEADAPRAGQPTFEVRVATWDRGAESGFPNLKVNVRAKQAGIVPRSIERVFDAGNRVTAHRFAFATADVSPEDLLLELTTRQQITTDAWRTGEAVIVNIDSGSGLIAPAAP